MRPDVDGGRGDEGRAMNAGSLLGGWAEFAAAFALFLVSHILPSRPARREALVRALGPRAYLFSYAAVSVVLLGWLIAAARRAPYVALWEFSPWQMWAPNLAMPVACLLAAFGLGAANPFSFGGRNADRFDPESPGMAGVTRHPLLWAVALWAGSHLAPNGDLVHVILFGSFAIFAVLGMVMIDRRHRAKWGDQEWRRLAARTSLAPFGSVFAGRWRPHSTRIDLPRALAAVAVYVFLVAAHEAVIGVSPRPIF
jgi:uncharacterized membrane protein